MYYFTAVERYYLFRMEILLVTLTVLVNIILASPVYRDDAIVPGTGRFIQLLKINQINRIF